MSRNGKKNGNGDSDEEYYDDDLWSRGNPYVRPDDPSTSKKAAKNLRKARDRKEALERCIQMTAFSNGECTRNEFKLTLIAWGYSVVRAESLRRRLTDLKNLGVLLVTDEERNGEEVLRLNEEMLQEILTTQGN